MPGEKKKCEQVSANSEIQGFDFLTVGNTIELEGKSQIGFNYVKMPPQVETCPQNTPG